MHANLGGTNMASKKPKWRKKDPSISIVQIVVANGLNEDADLVAYGLGYDNKMYVWVVSEGLWCKMWDVKKEEE
jgi:hypothetical protein